MEHRDIQSVNAICQADNCACSLYVTMDNSSLVFLQEFKTLN